MRTLVVVLIQHGIVTHTILVRLRAKAWPQDQPMITLNLSKKGTDNIKQWMDAPFGDNHWGAVPAGVGLH